MINKLKSHSENKSHPFIELIGWLGVIAIIGAYILLSFGYIVGQSYIYQGLNIFGSVVLIIESRNKKDFQPMVLNVVWIAIALIALISVYLKH